MSKIGKFPDFLVIGAMKAGTTALWSALRSHPLIFMSAVKEPGFFAYCNKRPAFNCPGSEHVLSLIVCDEMEYQNLFAPCPATHKAGEASAVYLDTPDAPANAFERIPNAKLIVMLRDPVERAFSNWVYFRQKGIEDCSNFEKALSQEEKRLQAGWRSGWGYRRKGFYGEQLDRWLSVYPKKSLLILFYEDWLKEPNLTLNKIFRHLDIPELHSIAINRENKSSLPRSGDLQRVIMGDNPFRTFARRYLPLWARDAIMWPMLKINLGPKPKLDPDLKKRLAKEFETQIHRVEEITGRNLNAWRE
jgi:hypothetical protein